MIPVEEQLPVGTLVVRGPDWKWGNQDGGEGNIGEVIENRDSDDWISVKWANGNKNAYRQPKCWSSARDLCYAPVVDDDNLWE